ncbi:hypothetical protein GXW84_19445 [Rhodococcus sp. IEGM 248]|uniref:hypothetical protein n=1 Tax=Rhodococcus opacus TaxID=37919 RepID=UPI0013C0C7FB|nr:hypothetical protein [Rhodococcus opacus]NDV06671.1 hypothetical protein [Rhodococcus sp. IEGM 248]
MFASVYCGAVLQEAAAIITATNAATWATERSTGSVAPAYQVFRLSEDILGTGS